MQLDIARSLSSSWMTPHPSVTTCALPYLPPVWMPCWVQRQ
jgi:hypothetical protein